MSKGIKNADMVQESYLNFMYPIASASIKIWNIGKCTKSYFIANKRFFEEISENV